MSPAVFAVLGVALIHAPHAADWPHWRGALRDGHTAMASGWTSGDWLPEAPAWTADVGAGTGGPLVHKGRVYAVGWADKKDTLRCLDLKTGKEEWAKSAPGPFYSRHHLGDEHFYGEPHATPEIDPTADRLYILGIDGDLRCWDLAAAGKLVWEVNLTDTYTVNQKPKITPVFHRDYGYTSSPLVWGDWVIAEVGATKHGTYIAFDKAAGKQAWASDLKDEGGNAGGLTPMRVGEVPCLVGFTMRNVAVVRLDGANAGKTLATQKWITEGGCNIPTPVAVGGSVLVTSGYDHYAIARFDVTDKGMTEVWRKKQSSKVCSPVVSGGSVYYSWHKVHCLDWDTGDARWSGGVYGEAGSCILTADERLVVYGGQGKVGLIEGAGRSPKKYQELAVRDRLFKATAWPHVAVAAGRLLCRDKDGHLV